MVFVFNTCVFGVLLTARLHFHQYAQSTKPRSKKPVIELVIPAAIVETQNAEFEWVKDWEFRYHGEMYDIEHSRKSGTDWVFACKHDSKEDHIRKQIEREKNQQEQQRDSRSKKNFKVGSDYFACSFELLIPHHYDARNIPVCASALRSPHRSLPDPPPWIG